MATRRKVGARRRTERKGGTAEAFGSSRRKRNVEPMRRKVPKTMATAEHRAPRRDAVGPVPLTRSTRRRARKR